MKTDDRVTLLKDLLTKFERDLPADYESRRDQILMLQSCLRRWAATVVEGPLNRRVDMMPQASLDEVKHLVSWVNTECRRLGLAVACPSTGAPSILIAAPRPDLRGGFAYRCEYKSEDGRRVRPFFSVKRPRIVLVDRTEVEDLWTAKVAGDRDDDSIKSRC